MTPSSADTTTMVTMETTEPLMATTTKRTRMNKKSRSNSMPIHRNSAKCRFPAESFQLILDSNLFCNILQFLSIRELCITVGRVCKLWYREASSNAIWSEKWRVIVHRMRKNEKNRRELDKLLSSTCMPGRSPSIVKTSTPPPSPQKANAQTDANDGEATSNSNGNDHSDSNNNSSDNSNTKCIKQLMVSRLLDPCPQIIDFELRMWRLPTNGHYYHRLRRNLGWIQALKTPDLCYSYIKLCSSIQILRRRGNSILDIMLPGIDPAVAKWVELEMKGAFMIRCGPYQIAGLDSESTMDKLFEERFSGLQAFSDYVLPRVGLEDSFYHRQNFLALCNILFNVIFNREKVPLVILPTVGKCYNQYPKCRWSYKY